MAGAAGMSGTSKGIRPLVTARFYRPALAYHWRMPWFRDRAAALAEAESLKERGNAQKAAGDATAAAASYRRAIELAPDYTAALYNLALLMRESGAAGEAERLFARVLEIEPGDADAALHLGSLLAMGARTSEAADVFRRALASAPAHVGLLMSLAGIAKALGARDEAASCYMRALQSNPDLAEAHNDVANLLQDEGRLDEAALHYREAIRCAPDYAPALANLGCVLIRRNQGDEAAACFREALALQPDLVVAHLNLGNLHALRGERDRAIECYRRAAELRPEDPAIREGLLFELQQTCDWGDVHRLAALQRASFALASAGPVSPFSLLSIPSTRAEQLSCARLYAQWQTSAVARERERLRPPPVRRQERRRLKIGYLSADFRAHPTAYWTSELFELHDRSRVEVLAYSYGPDDRSPTRERLRRAFDAFNDVAGLSHGEAAARILDDGIDILVDLTGYTQSARTEIVALRPAPVQVNFCGYPGTMGAQFIDYLVTNRFVVPPEHEPDYSEALVFIRGAYPDRKRPVEAVPPRSELGLPEDAFVACCFNQPYKILPEVFAAWMRLLHAVPRAVLWLLDTNRWAVANLRQEARRHGVDPVRLVFAPRVPLERYLARFGAADLFLDTRPYNAHTLTHDALWMGLPVLTCPGDTFASRLAASFVLDAGLPELVAGSMEAYEDTALRLARVPEELRALRARLAQARVTSPLFDTPRFTQALETAYETMWQRHVSGARPASIVISE
jgi:protein O-GlcNAc transferase